MDEREQSKRYNQELERAIREGKQRDSKMDQITRALLQTDFSSESRVRDPLKESLIRKSAQQIAEQNRRRRLGMGLKWIFRAAVVVGVIALAVLGFDRVYRLGLAPQATQTVGVVSTGPVLETPPVAATEAQAEPTATPQTTSIPGPAVAPIVTAGQVVELQWSLDGQWLGFKTRTQEQADQAPAGPGTVSPEEWTVNFLNPRTGESCQYAMENPQGLKIGEWYTWRADGSLLTLDQNRRAAALSSPCTTDPAVPFRGFPEFIDSILLVDSQRNLFLTSGQSGCYLYDARQGRSYRLEHCTQDASFSPDSRYLGQTLAFDQVSYATEIVDTTSGEVTGRLDWTFSEGGLGSLPGPQWIGPERFLIVRTDQGPLLVTLGEGLVAQKVADELLGLPGSSANQAAAAAQATGNDPYHIGMWDIEQGRSWLYHSEDGSSEELDASGVRLSQDGRWAILERLVQVEGYEQAQTWVRLVDPLGGEPRQVPGATYSAYAGWAPGMERVAVASESNGQTAEVRVYALPDLDLAQGWLVETATSLFPLVWSPDLAYLAVTNQTSPEGAQILFLLAFQ